MRVAVIGSGIAGLSAAYYLSRVHTVTLFEKQAQLGGHTYTVGVETPTGTMPVDMGFIVHNDRTYPNLVRLFQQLGVKTQPSDMSFSVFDRQTGFEYSSRGLSGFFAQRSNVTSATHYGLLREILRFNRESPALLADRDETEITMGMFLARGRYSSTFANSYLFPMASAVWSMPLSAIRDFPARTLVRFFANHGMLGINTHPKWKTVTGGSRSYIAPITEPYKRSIRLNTVIRLVSRTAEEVTLHFAEQPAETFDHVVFACHGNQILPILNTPTAKEISILGSFVTSRNDACLHTDTNMLPARTAARASWNYLLTDDATKPDAARPASLTYHMNRLQALPCAENYCVTLNATSYIDRTKVLRKATFYHPVYDLSAIRAQQRWSEISGQNRTHFCGAYWFYGFHEDGLNSARRVARALDAAPEDAT